MTHYVCLTCGVDYPPGKRHLCQMEHPKDITTPIESGFRILGASIEAAAVIIADAIRESGGTT